MTFGKGNVEKTIVIEHKLSKFISDHWFCTNSFHSVWNFDWEKEEDYFSQDTANSHMCLGVG